MDIKSYPVPDLDRVRNAEDPPAEAVRVLNELDASMRADDQHPGWYSSLGHHPQFQDFSVAQRELWKIRASGQTEQEPEESWQDKFLREQSERLADANRAMDELNGHGFQRAEVPSDLTQPEAEALQVQADAAAGRWDKVVAYLDDRMVQQPLLSGKCHELYRTFLQTDPSDQDLKCSLACKVLAMVATDGRRRMGLPPREVKHE